MHTLRYSLVFSIILGGVVSLIGATEIDVSAGGVSNAAVAAVEAEAETASEDVVKDEALGALLRHPRAQQLQGRILNNAQFVQHSESAQSFYLPPDLSAKNSQLNGNDQEHATNQLQQQQQQQQQPLREQTHQLQPEVIQVQVPSNEKKILLRLPPLQQHPQLQQQQQQLQQQQQQFGAYQPPPRRHYKIILVRSPPKQQSPPPLPVHAEVEEQTLIYVLVKKPDEPSVTELQALQQMQQNAVKYNKPEVYFIKYKANEQQQQQQQTQQHQQQQQQHEQQPVYSVATATDAAASHSQAHPQPQQQLQQQEQISNIIQRQLQRNNNNNNNDDVAASASGHVEPSPINNIGNGYP